MLVHSTATVPLSPRLIRVKDRLGVLLRLLLAMLVFSGLVSQSPAPATAQGSQAEWTVLIYYAADNNLEAFLMRRLNETEMLGSTDKVNFAVVADRSPAYWTGSDNWSGARYFHLEKDNNLFYIASPVAKDLGNVNSGAAETLQQFIEWGVKSYPARHYALIIANHGGGWQGAATDETSDDAIIGLAGMNRALSGALKSTGVDKFDLIVFDACLMGELEVWSSLAPYAHYGVASEEITYGLDGLNKAMADLVKNPALSPRDLGKVIVDYFAEYNGQVERGATLTMSEVDLDRVQELQSAMDRLAVVLTKDVATAETALAAAQGRAHSPAFADTSRDFFGMIDLRSFLLIIENLSENTEVVAAARQARNALKDDVVTYYAGDDVSSVGGLSFFFPANARLADIYVNGYKDVLEPIPGANDSLWIKFLNTYYTRLRQVVEKPTVSGLKLAKDTLLKGQRAEVQTVVGGVGLQEVDLLAGRAEGDALIAIDSNRIVLNEMEIVKGLKVPVWDPKNNPLSAWWDGAGWVLSNGERQVRAWVQASAPGSNIFAVPGYIHSVGGGTDLEGEIRFEIDMKTGKSYYIGAFAQKAPGRLGPYTFEPGDAFIVKRQLISLKDDSVEEKKGGTLIIGEAPPELLASPVPSGIYDFGVRAVNLAGDGTMKLAQVRVDNRSQPADYAAQSLSIITKRPGDWLVQEAPDLVTFTPDELSAVQAKIVMIPLEKADIDLDKALKAQLDSMAQNEDISNITPGRYSDAKLAGYDARRLDYTFDLENRGEISGSMVGCVDKVMKRLYLSLSEAPTKSVKDEQQNLDLVRDNIKLLPPLTLRDNLYTNQAMRFSLTYRGYWQVAERPASNEVFFVTSTFDGALRVQERPGKRQPTAADNDTLIKIYLAERLTREDAFQVGTPADVTISGLKGRRVEYGFKNRAGKAISGTVTAATTRDGRGYIINAEVDATSARQDTLTRDLHEMQSSFTIFDPEASPVPNPGEGWKVYENKKLHFGLAYLEDLDVEEDLSDPNFQVVSFVYGERIIAIDVANTPLSADLAPSAAIADRLVKSYVEKISRSLKGVKVGTLADMELAGIPARGISYGGSVEIGGELVEMEGSVLAAPTPYGFAYLVNVILPTQITGGTPVDAASLPHLLGTFTPLLQGLEPVSKIGAGGQQLKTYENAKLRFSITVPAAWRVREEARKVTFTGTDEVGRAIESYQISLEDQGLKEPMSPQDLDGALGKLLSDLEKENRKMEATVEPTDMTIGGLPGRGIEFVALRQGRELVDYTCILAQDQRGHLYLVTTVIPLDVLGGQRELAKLVLDSVQLTGKPNRSKARTAR